VTAATWGQSAAPDHRQTLYIVLSVRGTVASAGTAWPAASSTSLLVAPGAELLPGGRYSRVGVWACKQGSRQEHSAHHVVMNVLLPGMLWNAHSSAENGQVVPGSQPGAGGAIDEVRLVEFYAKKYGLTLAPQAMLAGVDRSAFSLLPFEICFEAEFCRSTEGPGNLVVGLVDPSDDELSPRPASLTDIRWNLA